MDACDNLTWMGNGAGHTCTWVTGNHPENTKEPQTWVSTALFGQHAIHSPTFSIQPPEANQGLSIWSKPPSGAYEEAHTRKRKSLGLGASAIPCQGTPYSVCVANRPSSARRKRVTQRAQSASCTASNSRGILRTSFFVLPIPNTGPLGADDDGLSCFNIGAGVRTKMKITFSRAPIE